MFFYSVFSQLLQLVPHPKSLAYPKCLLWNQNIVSVTNNGQVWIPKAGWQPESGRWFAAAGCVWHLCAWAPDAVHRERCYRGNTVQPLPFFWWWEYIVAIPRWLMEKWKRSPGKCLAPSEWQSIRSIPIVGCQPGNYLEAHKEIRNQSKFRSTRITTGRKRCKIFLSGH